tara:strand:- start:5732 stop:6736 length:1005 start_codon:yes stop_codon:yes gene_type:complete
MNQAEDLDLFDGDDSVLPNIPGSVPTREDPAPEPVAEGQFAPEPGPAPEPSGQPQNDHVPTGVMLDERRRRQAAEQEAQGLREQQAHITGRIQAWQEQQQQAIAIQQQAEAEPPPDRDEDPMGYLEDQLAQANQKIQGLENATQIGVARIQEQEAQAQLQAAQQSIVTESQTMQQKYAQQHPEYWDAFNHLATTRAQEYEMLGYSAEQVQGLVERDRGNLVGSCLKYDANGNAAGWSKNPAEVVMSLASARGFSAQRAPGELGTEPVMPASVPVPAASRAGYAAAGAQMARPGGAPANPGAPITAEALANMGDADFNRLMATNSEMVDVILGKT